MNMMIVIFFTSLALIFSVFMTGFIRQYSLKNAVLDIPNIRSSHAQPTPVGGGLSITLSILIVISILFFLNSIGLQFMAAFAGGILIAVTGWLDDRRHIPALRRALCYFIAAIWAVFCLTGLDHMALGIHIIKLPQWANIFVVVGIVWLTNLYNFMDGTDGIAAIQAICAGLPGGLFLILSDQAAIAVIPFVIAGSSVGFLYWNWPPARIFMGDVGSCFLGFTFALLAIVGEQNDAVPIIIWFILLSGFICDATFTLLMRMIKREKWYSAHKSHAYQRVVQMGISHKTLAI